MATTEGKYKAWDKKLKKMSWVVFVSVEEGYAILKDRLDKQIPLSDIELLPYMKRSDNRKGIYKGDIVNFTNDSNAVIAEVIREDSGQWFYHVPLSGEKISPKNLKDVHVIGNKFEDAQLLSEEWARLIKITHIRDVLSSHQICEHEYCRHDLENAISKLSELSKEELVDLIKSMADDLRDYKKSYFEECSRNRHNR